MATKSQPSSGTYPSIRLFKNGLLEALTHVHPVIPFLIWVPVVIYFLFHSVKGQNLGALTVSGFFLLGLLFWTWIEYIMHRYVFHYPATTKVGKYLVFLFHGIHHDDPQDPTRLVMPPVVSLVLGIVFFFIFQAVLEEKSEPFFSGFIAGYLVYDFMHFAIHHFKPVTQVGKSIKENHMKHHFIEHGAKWGVSSPFWDHVYRTFE